MYIKGRLAAGGSAPVSRPDLVEIGQPEQPDSMVGIFSGFHPKTDPSRVRQDMVMRRLALGDQLISDLSGEGNIHQPAPVKVPDLHLSHYKFRPAKAMRMCGDAIPLSDSCFDECQSVFH